MRMDFKGPIQHKETSTVLTSTCCHLVGAGFQVMDNEQPFSSVMNSPLLLALQQHHCVGDKEGHALQRRCGALVCFQSQGRWC